MVLYCKDRLLSVRNAENDAEVRNIRKNVFNRLDAMDGGFVGDFESTFNAILANIPVNKQLQIVSVKLESGYCRNIHLER